MGLIKVLRTLRFMFLMVAIVTIVSSCGKDEDGSTNVGVGTITGVVTDNETGNPIADVNVAITDVKGNATTVTTGSDGKYTVPNVPKNSHAVSFTKKGYQTISITVVAKDYNEEDVAVISTSMLTANSVITGVITDAKNNNAPLAGVVVSIGAAGSDTTGADGRYSIENLLLDSYTVTFSKAAYALITRPVSKESFINGVASLDVQMGATELLRGLTAADLANADKWYYNEYRGGGNADAYPHWDWACDYMSSLTFVGRWEEQWEGTTLRIRNDAVNQANPANLDVFDSYTYGSKKITADNKTLSLRVRTHNADVNAPTYFGVQVIDLSVTDPAAVKIGDIKSYGSDQYADFDFDLSAYIGKEIIIAVGIYRQATGNYDKQLVLRAVRFANQKVSGWDWLPGNEVVSGWKLTQETVRSTMPHTKKSFTGISPMSAGRDVNMSTGYPAAYQAWRNVSHIGAEWSFVPLKKDPEVFPSEGYLIKTRNTAEVSTEVPEAYFYSKFAIASGSNQFTLKTRNFSTDQYTYFKLTAIQEDGTVTHIAPSSNTAQEALAAENGCWKFKHNAGSKGSPADYASFVYDLSQFNGSNVVLVLGVYNGAANSGENKLVLYSINLN